ncbi:MAG: sensor histidine kinase [Bacteroidetes bacterium]|nr:sensor histidine kinase [Rhodothermaceae bacterium RA]RMH59548.1 MAG: sensor histidine kinase [Bacteroidota bacterium]
MFLTFALFVGSAVVVVALYVVLVLRGDTREATRQMLEDQAGRIAVLLESARSTAERRTVVQDIARLTDLDVAFIAGDSVYLRTGTLPLIETTLPATEDVRAAMSGQVGVSESTDEAGRRMLFVTLPSPDGTFLVRVGQPEPPLFALVREMQATLIAGMVMALVMALLGSWIAADKVTDPMRTISRIARQVSDGDFDEPIEVDSQASEIQDMAQSLNRMSESFREKIEELERLTRIQTEFIGNVSHEVRNPIFAVGGYLEALSMPNLTDDQRQRYAEKALLNLQRLNNLFNDLIEIARLEYREDLIKPSVFNLQELLEEVTEMLAPRAEAKHLELEVKNPPMQVLADRNRIRQVLTNLIENAIAYSDSGTVRCRFRRRIDKVRIEVIDNGRGIPDDHLDRIFERFHRVDPDRSRKSGGTGLGLSIVKQILQAHGETIHVESTLGRGSRFWFELPYAGQAETEPA